MLSFKLAIKYAIGDVKWSDGFCKFKGKVQNKDTVVGVIIPELVLKPEDHTIYQEGKCN